jgi:hypothetical protein
MVVRSGMNVVSWSSNDGFVDDWSVVDDWGSL